MSKNSKQVYNYTVILEREEEGGYHAFCPLLKGCHSQEDNFEEAIANIQEAIELYLESYDIPAQMQPQEKDIESLRQAVDKFSNMLAEKGISEDDIIADFQAFRKRSQ
ncbi:MAG: hypothetical protein RLZZ507_4444 [Cyanobacteriota bacterium]|jgi:predicted RNase H-like HicB family nuclease